MPAGAKRYQFMVKDRAKYKDTDGWGYALFTAKGHAEPGDEAASTMACAACHRIVPERDFVFSRWAFPPKDAPALPHAATASLFVTVKAGTLPALKPYLGNATTVESVGGEIGRHAFSGTFDEVVPLLLEHAAATRLSSALFVDARNFSVVRPIARLKKCDLSDTLSFAVVVVFNAKKVRDAKVCR